MASVLSCKGYGLRNILSALVHGTAKHYGFTNLMVKAALPFFMMRIWQPVMLNNISWSDTAIQASFGFTKKNTVLRLTMESRCRLKRSSAYPGLGSKYSMSDFCIICISFYTRAKADNICLSNTMVNCCYGKTVCPAGKNDTLWCLPVTSGSEHSR